MGKRNIAKGSTNLVHIVPTIFHIIIKKHLF
jgi:hypothetical protein